MAFKIFIVASTYDPVGGFANASVGEKPVALNEKFSLSVRE
jgi:hypothetical protein